MKEKEKGWAIYLGNLGIRLNLVTKFSNLVRKFSKPLNILECYFS